MIDPHLLADIKAAEGCSFTCYNDSLGFPTIGYGHYLSVEQPGIVWSQEQCDAELEMDIELAQGYAQALPEWKYLDTPCRQNAVTELYFNMGSKWLSFLETRTAIKLQHWQAAHDGLLNSLWATQVGPTRSQRLAGYFLTGRYV